MSSAFGNPLFQPIKKKKNTDFETRELGVQKC